MKSSVYLSLGLLAAVVAWMLSGAVASVPEEPAAQETPAPATVEKMRVLVREVLAQEITREIVVQGELEPLRQVEIRAQTDSRVAALPVAKGHRVEQDTILIRLAEEDRAARLKQAQAEVASQRLEVQAARRLQQQGLQAETRLRASEAALAAAEANLRSAKLELDYLRIRAPFPGVLEQRHVELGSHVDVGEPVALLVDETVLKAVGNVSQQSAGRLALDQPIKVRLLDGREAEGRVTYIARVGDSETHSFRVEAEVPNPDGRLQAGISAELRIAAGRESAHFLSPAVLALDSSGEVGVKSVNDQGLVDFHPITLVRTEAGGVWVSGLPERARVITQGQGFVNAGEDVIPVPAS